MLKSFGKDTGQALRKLWSTCTKIPGGRHLFNRTVGMVVPYTGTIGLNVTAFEPGRVVAQIKDRRGIRNHLNCIHAMAIANFGEAVSGLAVMSSLPPLWRGILVKFEVEYIKKARVLLQAEARAQVNTSLGAQEYIALVDLKNSDNEIVARVRATWKIGPNK